MHYNSMSVFVTCLMNVYNLSLFVFEMYSKYEVSINFQYVNYVHCCKLSSKRVNTFKVKIMTNLNITHV